MPLFLNHMYADAAIADELIEKSGCEWVIVRPMSFTNGAKTGNITVVTNMSLTVSCAFGSRVQMSRRFSSSNWLGTITSARCQLSTHDLADCLASILTAFGYVYIQYGAKRRNFGSAGCTLCGIPGDHHSTAPAPASLLFAHDRFGAGWRRCGAGRAI